MFLQAQEYILLFQALELSKPTLIHLNQLRTKAHAVEPVLLHNQMVLDREDVRNSEESTMSDVSFKEKLIEDDERDHTVLMCQFQKDIATEKDERMYMFGGIDLMDSGDVLMPDTKPFYSLAYYKNLFGVGYEKAECSFLMRHYLAAAYLTLRANNKLDESKQMTDEWENVTAICRLELEQIKRSDMPELAKRCGFDDIMRGINEGGGNDVLENRKLVEKLALRVLRDDAAILHVDLYLFHELYDIDLSMIMVGSNEENEKRLECKTFELWIRKAAVYFFQLDLYRWAWLSINPSVKSASGYTVWERECKAKRSIKTLNPFDNDVMKKGRLVDAEGVEIQTFELKALIKEPKPPQEIQRNRIDWDSQEVTTEAARLCISIMHNDNFYKYSKRCHSTKNEFVRCDNARCVLRGLAEVQCLECYTPLHQICASTKIEEELYWCNDTCFQEFALKEFRTRFNFHIGAKENGLCKVQDCTFETEPQKCAMWTLQ